MSQKTYMYDTQWQALINAIQGGDPTAIVTALGQIKTSIEGITTALGSLSTDVTQDSTQWTALVNAISSGGGGGGGTIDIDATQWSDLLTEIGKGDMTATATALNNIYTRLNSIGFNSTQWTNLVNAITNQSLTVDLSNITSSVVSNLSNISGSTLTDALNSLNTITESAVTPITAYSGLFWYNRLYKKAGIVYVDVEFSDPSGSPLITTYNTQIKIGTLPIGYRPMHRLYVTFAIMNQNNGAYQGTGQSLIDVNGDIYINIPRQCNFSCIQVAYIVNGN